MSTTPRQTEAQRLADKIDRISELFKSGSHASAVCAHSAALLLRQDELLRQALEALDKEDSNAGYPNNSVIRKSIRAHLEAK